MVNNIGTISKKLNIELGRTTEDIVYEDIKIITGEFEKGFLIFDEDGTIGVISEFTDQENFVLTTYALSIDIEKILGLSY